jgi:hypothetical protein
MRRGLAISVGFVLRLLRLVVSVVAVTPTVVVVLPPSPSANARLMLMETRLVVMRAAIM